MKLKYATSFERDLRAIKEQSVRSQVRAALETLQGAPSLREVSNVKKLQGEENAYRIRVGEFRIGAVLQDDTLVLVRFLHRRDIYRYFP
jgi:mRNA-degrading endonuclease RelE of RelBE toxin-antitoxin system